MNVPAVTVIVALPAPTAFTVALLPSPVTVATFLSSDSHLTSKSSVAFAGSNVTFNLLSASSFKLRLSLSRAIFVTAICSTVTLHSALTTVPLLLVKEALITVVPGVFAVISPFCAFISATPLSEDSHVKAGAVSPFSSSGV